MYNYIKKKVKLVTMVEYGLKASFSMATTPGCEGRALLVSLDYLTIPLIPILKAE